MGCCLLFWYVFVPVIYLSMHPFIYGLIHLPANAILDWCMPSFLVLAAQGNAVVSTVNRAEVWWTVCEDLNPPIGGGTVVPDAIRMHTR